MTLLEFHNDKQTLNTVRAYLASYIEAEAVRMLLNREGTMALADAKELLDKAWANLDVAYSPKPKRTLDQGPR